MAAKKDSRKEISKNEEDKGISLKDAVQIKRPKRKVITGKVKK